MVLKRKARARRIRLIRRYHLHTPGLLFVGATVLVLLGALNSGNNLLYWIFGAAIGIVIVSGVLSGSSLMGLRIEGYPPDSTTAGGTAMLRYRLRNTSRWVPAVALSLEDVSKPGPKGERLVARGWLRSLAPGQTIDLELHAPTRHRGQWEFKGLRASTTYPFGLTRKSVLALQPRTLTVRPRPAPVRSSMLVGTLGGGLRTRRTNAHLGLRGEPYGLREYVPGDSYRSIAWRASARTGELRVTEESLPTHALFRIAFRLPADASEEFADAAVELAAGACLAAARAGIPIEIEGIEAPAGGYTRLLDSLAVFDPRGRCESAPLRGAVVIADAARSGRKDMILDVRNWAERREVAP